MRARFWLVRAARGLLVGAVVSSALWPVRIEAQETVPQQPGPAPRVDSALVSQLKQEAPGAIQVETHHATGKVRFIGTSPGQPVRRSSSIPAGTGPEDAARSFLDTYGPLFGTTDQARDLSVKREKWLDGGRSVVRFTQEYRGVPVFAGELVVQLDAARNVQAAAGELLPDLTLDTRPTVSAPVAADTARAATAKEHQLNLGALTLTEPSLSIYNPALIGEAAAPVSKLVWRVEAHGGPLDHVRQLVLVDAQTGHVALSFNQVPDAKNRRTHTANNSATIPGTLVCDESNSSCSGGDTDAVNAHQYASDTYDFYQTHHGRDSINGAGVAIVQSVHYNDASCPNAFWNGSQASYCNGLVVDDIVAHELTHAVTQYESNLVYLNQSGAINESFSDVWGEFIDLTNGRGNDTSGVRWQMGEDWSVIRNMANPPAHNDPDRMTSPLFYLGSGDNGGVHINSGVNNKAASLLVDGGSFNGYTINAIGIPKTAKIYYEVQTNLLTPGSDYADLGTALPQACTSLIGVAGISSADCQEVTKVVQATEMLLPGGPALSQPAMCPTGQIPQDVFFDDLENASSGNWVSAALQGANQWSYPPGSADVRATSGTKNFFAADPASVTDSVMAKASSVALPAGSRIRFNHEYTFESGYDGGILEYSANGGSSWLNAGSLITHNGYTVTLPSTWSNPLGGQQAWSGSAAYRPVQLDLTSIGAISQFKIRFRIGTDNSISARGWFIDDVRIYTCVSGSPGVVLSPSGGLVTTESGGTAALTARLNTAPTADVVLPLSSSDTTEGTVSPTSLTFTALNGMTPQTVTLTGVDDTALDGNVGYSLVTGTLSSGDTGFGGVDPPNVSVTNQDNEAASAGITVTPTSGLTTTESGGQATFQVSLTSVPTGDVTINLSSSNSSEGTVSPSTLVFTPGNALTPRTVTITGVDDGSADGDVSYTVITAPATSSDPSYSGRNAADVSVTNQDNECIGPTISAVANGSGGLTVTINAPRAMSQIVFRGASTSQVSGPNAAVDIQGGPSNQAVNTDYTYSVPNGATSVVFTLRRQQPDRTTTLPLEISMPGCSTHRTFVGGGPGAF